MAIERLSDDLEVLISSIPLELRGFTRKWVRATNKGDLVQYWSVMLGKYPSRELVSTAEKIESKSRKKSRKIH